MIPTLGSMHRYQLSVSLSTPYEDGGQKQLKHSYVQFYLTGYLSTTFQLHCRYHSRGRHGADHWTLLSYSAIPE